ncbi:Serine acetyltransferase [Buttiauxella agrestis]|uniref:Serine acetyltransferase n=1 Tax=Buttiauxella agrestis TaxID=82977 RepID=A0A381C5W3_9ENTR|nr:serine O-acetyltransferase [Buttiauxella agrestis]SUW63308.1 Serine acetyltransferase [Buttiauxella agrestis]
MLYLHSLLFVIFGKNEKLWYYWQMEIIRRPYFSVVRLLREKKLRHRNFLFWWRLANEMYINGNKPQRKAAEKLNNKLIERFGCEIGLGAHIGKGLMIPHHSGIVIHSLVDIGENFVIRQNTVIGQIDTDSKALRISIGNNVDIGANTCIIGLSVKIGDNVKIGAMSFIKSNIPSNCTYITDKTSRIIIKENISDDI